VIGTRLFQSVKLDRPAADRATTYGLPVAAT
jgi:hypothetical protein